MDFMDFCLMVNSRQTEKMLSETGTLFFIKDHKVPCIELKDKSRLDKISNQKYPISSLTSSTSDVLEYCNLSLNMS